MKTVEDICNAALDAIGYKRHIGSIWEGSLAARIALDVYAQTRDEHLHTLTPDWARGDAQLELLRSAPPDFYQDTPWTLNFPPQPWRFEYRFPVDCVNPLQIKPKWGLSLWRPRYIPFRLNIDALDGINTILCNEPEAICSYTRLVTNPDIWHDDFTAIIIAALAKKFAPLMPSQEPRNDTAGRRGEQGAR